MSDIGIKGDKVFECLECNMQWAEKVPSKLLMCYWCHSKKVELVCDMTSQMHLLVHEEAIC